MTKLMKLNIIFGGSVRNGEVGGFITPIYMVYDISNYSIYRVYDISNYIFITQLLGL